MPKPIHSMTDSEYLRNLAERIMHIAVMHGVDQYDAERLARIAKRLQPRAAT